MKRLPVAVFSAALALATILAGPTAAQSDAETTARLDALFGESKPYREFLAALQAAVSAGDREAVSAMVSYPLETTTAAGRVMLRSEADVVARYDDVFTPAVVSAVEKQTYATLFANAEGVMIGDGEVWFSGVCSDDACTETSVKVIAVNVPD